MNVLSLFDGISCGQIALNRADVKYDRYFASEIDNNAIKVTNKHFPETIQLGSVLDLKSSSLPMIDLLFGGSPCQGFSLSGKRLNFEDTRSKLFFEFIRIKNELNPKYFLLENVKMQKDIKDAISEYIGLEPVKINSSLVSAQNRERLYWTNIPTNQLTTDKDIFLGNILEKIETGIFSGVSWRNNRDIYVKITENIKYLLGKSKYKDSFNWKFDKLGRILVSRPDGEKIQRIGRICSVDNKSEILMTKNVPIINDGKFFRKISPLEAERLQTIPDKYTDILSNRKRYHAIGNGWTVDIICHILKGMYKQ